MALESITVRRYKKRFETRGVNLSSSTAYGIATERILNVVPSVCKKDGQTDGLVNARVRIDDGDGPSNYTDYWVTQTVAEVIALDD